MILVVSNIRWLFVCKIFLVRNLVLDRPKSFDLHQVSSQLSFKFHPFYSAFSPTIKVIITTILSLTWPVLANSNYHHEPDISQIQLAKDILKCLNSQVLIFCYLSFFQPGGVLLFDYRYCIPISSELCPQSFSFIVYLLVQSFTHSLFLFKVHTIIQNQFRISP